MGMPKEACGTECQICKKWHPWLQLFLLNSSLRKVCGECYDIKGGRSGPYGDRPRWNDRSWQRYVNLMMKNE